jgi:4-amino-4-deoxy-L-arabinose transferase-like glycosyltransferase
MNRIINQKLVVFALIIFCAIFLRAWKLMEAPPGFNRDEASIGYTAYSLLKTGRDEYGIFLPISLKSFGDWKLPLYPYLTIPAVAIFGLTDLSVRLPSVIFGIMTVILAYFLAKELLGAKLYFEFLGLKIDLPLVTMFFLAISPWHIFFSRVASEANLAIFFDALGVLFFLRGAKNRIFFLLSGLTLAIPLFAYHGNHIFTPLLFIGLIIIYWKKIFREKFFWLGFTLFCIMSFIIFSQTLFSADKTKISGLFPLENQNLVYQGLILPRIEHQDYSSLSARLLHNKLNYFINFVLQNYLKGFSTEFLFIKGGSNPQHNIPQFGNLYLWQAPFLLIGLFFLFKEREQNRHLLVWWLLISPLAASITLDAPHSARMAAILPVLEILTAYGFVKSIDSLRPNWQRTLSCLAAVFFIIFNFSNYLDRYFIHFPYETASYWGAPYKELTEIVFKIKDSYKEIIMARPDYSPYIYFVFYGKVDPSLFQKEVKHYPPSQEGFEHVASFSNFQFNKIDWAESLNLPDRLYIDWAENVPPGATKSAILVTKEIEIAVNGKMKKVLTKSKIKSELIGQILLPDGKPQFYIIGTKEILE